MYYFFDSKLTFRRSMLFNSKHIHFIFFAVLINK